MDLHRHREGRACTQRYEATPVRGVAWRGQGRRPKSKRSDGRKQWSVYDRKRGDVRIESAGEGGSTAVKGGK